MSTYSRISSGDNRLFRANFDRHCTSIFPDAQDNPTGRVLPTGERKTEPREVNGLAKVTVSELPEWSDLAVLRCHRATSGACPSKGADGAAFTSRWPSFRDGQSQPCPKALREIPDGRAGPFPEACKAQKSGQSWHRCLRILTHSPLARGSKA